jgi:thioredoxin reductase
LDQFLNKGVYREFSNLDEFRDKRVIVVENGEPSIELAIKLTEITGRVIFITPLKMILASKELQLKLKMSDVKVLHEAELIEILGGTTLEKVKVHDLNEDTEYELFVDAVILP